MDAISKISLPELAPQKNENVSLTKRRGPSLPEGTGLALMLLQRQTEARYSNQVIEEETKEMHLVEWEEMAIKHGLQLFRDALSKAIRESKFFPAPDDIREWCESIAESRRNESSAQKYIREMDEAKAQWERERAEQKTEVVPDRPAARTAEEVHDFIDRTVDKDRIAEFRTLLSGIKEAHEREEAQA